MIDAETLATLAATEEVVLVMHREGHPDRLVPVWVVVVDGTAYLRSYKGVGSVWFRRALADPHQALALGGAIIDAMFEPIGDELEQRITEAFLQKYSRHSYASSMAEPLAVEATVRLS